MTAENITDFYSKNTLSEVNMAMGMLEPEL